MEIKKHVNDYGSFDITLSDSDKVLSIFLGGDDVNISCRFVDYKKITEIKFNIPEEESEIYSIFEKLYTNIINGNVLGENEEDDLTKRKMEIQRNYSWYSEIVKNGLVTIISDAYPINCPDVLRISKRDGRIVLWFIQENSKEFRQPKNPYCININVRQSGSRLYDFCFPFRTLFRDLQHVDDPKMKTLKNKL